jgi:hypothetical protein
MSGSRNSLTSAVDGCEQSAAQPGRLTPLGTYRTEGCVDPNTGLGVLEKKKKPLPLSGIEPTIQQLSSP